MICYIRVRTWIRFIFKRKIKYKLSNITGPWYIRFWLSVCQWLIFHCRQIACGFRLSQQHPHQPSPLQHMYKVDVVTWSRGAKSKACPKHRENMVYGSAVDVANISVDCLWYIKSLGWVYKNFGKFKHSPNQIDSCSRTRPRDFLTTKWSRGIIVLVAVRLFAI